MKLELKENMYVRTNDGIIAKVDYIDDNTIFFDKDLYRTYSDSIDFLEKDDLERIVKADYKIIKILECGDILVDDTNRKLEILLIDDELMIRNTGLIYDNNYYLPIKSIAIKSVITHEQMEQISYKIGDDKE